MKIRSIAAGLILLTSGIAQAAFLDDDVSLGTFIRRWEDLGYVSFYDDKQTYAHDFPDGWVSRFGALNGGRYFDTDFIELGATSTAHVTWDFTGISDLYQLRYIWVLDIEPSYSVSKVYHVRGKGPSGEGTISLPDDGARINEVGFFGTLPFASTPDAGSTLSLMAVALGALAFVRRMAHG